MSNSPIHTLRRVARASLLHLALVLPLSCGASHAYRMGPGSPKMEAPSGTSFLVVADTQYAVPFTDYEAIYKAGSQHIDLPPEVLAGIEGSFYRHAAAHWAVLRSLSEIVGREKPRRQFGLFGGDMVEFSCADEATDMLKRLEEGGLPFIVALGNHDALFHGSYDTDAVGESGHGAWDVYSFELWKSVCAQHGGRLTKTGYIRKLLAYYQATFGFDFKKALHLGTDDYPLGANLTGTVSNGSWTLDFSVRLTSDDSPSSHRQSHFYQRWSRQPVDAAKSGLTVTVLDSTDYAARPALCDDKSIAFQIGMAGGITADQVSWFEGLGKPTGTHLVLSHYIPFQDIEGIVKCETLLGTRCLGRRLADAFGPATYVYAHVHREFEPESLARLQDCEREEPGKDPSTCAKGREFPLVRLPSLIDNKSYVVFQGGAFQKVHLEPAAHLESVQPLQANLDTCEQRFAEYVELEHDIRCFKAGEGGDCTPGSLAKELASRKNEGVTLCGAPPTTAACSAWPRSEAWRCELLAKANAVGKDLPPGAATAVLSVVLTRTDSPAQLPTPTTSRP